MSQAIRQSEMFAGNDWLAAYRAFTEVNLNAFDFATIRESMVEYIRRNYPEDFNDWIESSEFVAIIDLLAYLGQSLAFRTDINARENFLDLARRRESVLRLARSLSYNAKRNYPARGLAKITEIKTTQDVRDSAGRNLNNVVIRWDDPNNPDWFEQWILVLNSAFVSTNPFGRSLAPESIDGVQTQLYRINNIPISAGNFPFSASVNGESLPFDVVNPNISSTFGIVEQAPDPESSFHIIYRSDGNGNSSPNTGFFVYIKQGTLQKSDFVITEPQENRTIFIDTANINETDIWVQTVTDNGTVVPDGHWTRVGHVPTDEVVKVLLTAENITYNDIDPEVQNIYQPVTQEDDKVALRFGDGRFGKSPVGNLRVWYRVSANRNLSVRPEDIHNVQINVPFTTHNNTQKRLTLTFSLQETISNSVASETNDEVRRRASRVASTQGRMVSGSDYNNLPVQTNLAVKLKAVNRVYSGQNRYLDLNDPTGSYQNTNVFGDDGALYIERDNMYVEVAHNQISVDEIMSKYLTDMVNSTSLRDFVMNEHYRDPARSHIIKNNFTTAFLRVNDVKRAITERLQLNRTFGLGFDYGTAEWYVMDSNDMNPDITVPYDFNPLAKLNGPTSWLIYCEYNPKFWRFTCRGISYVFESERTCKFFFINEFKSIDPQTGRTGSDTIKLLKKANGLATNLVFELDKPYIYSDGFVEPNRVKVKFYDSNADGAYDNENSYYEVKNASGHIVVHQIIYSTDGYASERLLRKLTTNDSNSPAYISLEPSEYGYMEISRTQVRMYVGHADGVNRTSEVKSISDDIALIGNNAFRVRGGSTGLCFQWKHFAPSSHRIDPAISNIIDIFVLTREYNNQMISWRNSGANPATMPKAPTELQLRMTFSQLEEYKMFSDEIIWRPVKFKLLFGQSADPKYQAKFKIVKLAGTAMSDGEIKSRVIESIRTFFDVNMWEFGETFYFSELGSYIHQQLSTAISSVEIVPIDGTMYFGDLREIHCQPDELFFATAQVSDVEIINANTPTNLRIKRW